MNSGSVWPNPNPTNDPEPSTAPAEATSATGVPPVGSSLSGVPPSSAFTGGLAQPATGATTVMPGTGIPVVVGDEGKSPKVPFIVAGALAAIGVVSFLISAAIGASAIAAFDDLSTEDYTMQHGNSVTLTYDDDDGLGEEGWYLLIPGDPKADVNNNGIMDDCEGIVFTVTDGQGNDVSDQVARISCSTDTVAESSNAGEPYYDIENHIVVARMCYTIEEYNDAGEYTQEHDCSEGDRFTFSNNASVNMSVVDLDAMFLPVIEEAIGAGIGAFAAGAAGCFTMCGGIIALIVALIRVSSKPKGSATMQQQFIMQ